MKLKKTADKSDILVQNVPVFEADAAQGLSGNQAALRAQSGLCNTPVDSVSKTTKQIILSNVFTYFNMIFCLFAVGIIVSGASLQNLTFMGVIIINTLIGIVQELRSKKALDKLSIVSAPKAKVIREGREETIPTSDTVRDDIVVFSSGNQIYADAVVLSGTCQVNEALITGEADEIKKEAGDTLLSGSFVINGNCCARLTAVGADSFASKLTIAAKKSKKPKMSEMMRSLKKLIKWIGFIIIPFGVVLLIKEISWLHRDLATGMASTIAALLGMIPEGLYLLTSIALVAGVLRLSQRKTLVHEMACIETLARVDTLCVDKTGTITENKMTVDEIALTCEDRFVEADIRMIMADYVYAMQDDNDTMAALKKYFTGTVRQKAIDTLPFSSSRKYGGVSFHEDETYILGAPDVILGDRYSEYAEKVDAYSAKGCRVLLLALYDGTLHDEVLDKPIMPIALILLTNKIRSEAPATFKYFAEQGVTVKVISGDNAMAVSEVAKRAGIQGAENYVDARALRSDSDIRAAVEKYNVFGRVTPEQKRKLVRALKAKGHTVAMTGDGVNDVLALKEADCSIAMASGSDVASQVSHIVLMKSNFSAMPSVVREGRRVINNIERSASLYLVKNVFSFLLAFITLFASLPYPFTPAQLSLVNALTIGIPAFVFAMEPNEQIVSGKFLSKVIYRALPGALTDLVLIVGILLFYLAFGITEGALSTICTFVMGVVGLCVIHNTCKPYTALRRLMMITMAVVFLIAFLFFKQLFTLSAILWSDALIMIVFALLAYPVMKVIEYAVDRVAKSIKSHPRRYRRRKA